MGRRRLGHHVINIIIDGDDEEEGEAIALNFRRFFRAIEQHGHLRLFCDTAALEDFMKFGNTIRGKGKQVVVTVEVQ
jgi:hypothetical protein